MQFIGKTISDWFFCVFLFKHVHSKQNNFLFIVVILIIYTLLMAYTTSMQRPYLVYYQPINSTK